MSQNSFLFFYFYQILHVLYIPYTVLIYTRLNSPMLVNLFLCCRCSVHLETYNCYEFNESEKQPKHDMRTTIKGSKDLSPPVTAPGFQTCGSNCEARALTGGCMSVTLKANNSCDSTNLILELCKYVSYLLVS